MNLFEIMLFMVNSFFFLFQNLFINSKLPVRCTDNIIMFYVNFFWRVLYIYYSIFVIKLC